ncbi:MAG: hypothetical protein EUB_02801 [Eubacterium sp.]
MMPPPEYLMNLKEWAAAITTIAAVFVLVCTPVGSCTCWHGDLVFFGKRVVKML